jgi:hypothetical protein
MESDHGYPAKAHSMELDSQAQRTEQVPKLEQVFDMAADDKDEEELVAATENNSPKEGPKNGLVQPESANDASETLSQGSAGEPKASIKAGFGMWASSLRQKASILGRSAAKAIVEEARLVTEDVRDLGHGVREGMNLTKQDLEASWRGVLGAKLRNPPLDQSDQSQDQTPPSTATSSTDTAAGVRSASPEAPVVRALDVLRQNLAATAEASKEVWRDLGEMKEEVLKEVRTNVTDMRQVLQKTGTKTPEAETAGLGPGKMLHDLTERDAQDDVGLDKVKAAVRKTAGELTQTLRQRLQNPQASVADAVEPYWLLPSARANYVSLEVDTSFNQNQGLVEAVSRVRKLGGRLKGSIARKSREVSSGIATIARDVGKISDESPLGKLTALRPQARADSGDATKNRDEAFDGDSIFEIGSDGDAAWSDVEEDAAASDSNTSATLSTRSASVAHGVEGAVHAASEADVVEIMQ